MVSKSAVIRVFSALVALALAVFAAGCGGGDEAAAPLPKAQFVKQADAICNAESRRFQRLFEAYVHENHIGLPPERTHAQWTGIVENALAPTIEARLERIRALGIPRGDSRQVNAVLNAVEDGLQEVRETPSVEADAEAQFAKSTRLARAYGFRVCD